MPPLTKRMKKLKIVFFTGSVPRLRAKAHTSTNQAHRPRVIQSSHFDNTHALAGVKLKRPIDSFPSVLYNKYNELLNYEAVGLAPALISLCKDRHV